MPSFLGTPVPPSFDVRSVSVPPGAAIPYRGGDWEGAIVSVEQGELEAECRHGGRRRFPAGSLLYLERLPLRALHSCGETKLVLLAIARASHTPARE